MIESTCGYIIREGKWLLLYRNKKKEDVNAGKWIGVGGKLENGETAEECMIRETIVETGLTIHDPKLRGEVYFIYEDRETERIYIFTSHRYDGSLTDCNEGTLAWIAEEQLGAIPMWEGDRLFLNRLKKDTGEFFTLYLHYDREGNLLKAEEGDCV